MVRRHLDRLGAAGDLSVFQSANAQGDKLKLSLSKGDKSRKIVVQIWRKDFCRFTEEKDAWARLSRGSTKSIQVLEILLKSTLLGISRHWRAWRRGFAAEFHKKCVAVFRQGRSRFGSRLFSAVFHPRLLSRTLSRREASLPTTPILQSRQIHSHRANAGRVTQNHDPRLCWCTIQK